MPIKITPTKGKKKKQNKKSSGAAPFMMPGQKKMLDKMMGKSKPQTLKGGGGLKAVPQGNKGKGLSKLPTEVRNKMGYMKKGGKVMKMRGGGAATRGLMFNNK
tara:strand:+ start:4929 stop:5237 length:309 start_codon:yes stop_codon:yes gene_type:complete